MSNFILEFLKNKINKKQEKTWLSAWEIVNLKTNMDIDNKHIDTKSMKIKEQNPDSEEDIKINSSSKKKLRQQQQATQNELKWYLSNNSDLDNSMIEMNKDKKEETHEISKEIKDELNKDSEASLWINSEDKKQKIEIVKQKPYKSVYWIFRQFIIWSILITLSAIYVYWNGAEYKFMKSSIDLWKNTVNNIMSNVGWAIWDDAKKWYISKKAWFVDELTALNKKIEKCIKDKNEDKDKIEYLEKIQERASILKIQLMDWEVVSLDKFIKDFEQYSLWVNSLKTSVKNECD